MKFIVKVLFVSIILSSLFELGFCQSTLTVGYRYPVWNLNPYSAQDRESQEVCDLIYASIISVDSKLRNVAEMSSQPPASWNPPNLTIPLRTDVRWHSQTGMVVRNFSSKDINATYEYLDENKNLPGASKVSNIKTMLPEGRNRIKIIFNPGQFSYRDLNFKIVPEVIASSPERIKRFGKTIETSIGTGPYQLLKWDKKNNKMTLKYSDNGFLSQRPMVQTIHINVTANEQQRTKNLIDGNIDLITDLPPTYSAQLKGNKAIKVLDYRSVELSAILFNYRPYKNKKRNPTCNLFKNRDLRIAITIALDKKLIYEVTFQEMKKTFPSITGPFLPGTGAYNSEVKDYKWLDSDFNSVPVASRRKHAKKLLKRVLKVVNGKFLVPGNKLELLYLSPGEKSTNNNRKIAKSVMGQLKIVGLKIEAIGKEKTEYYKRLKNGDFDMVLYEWPSSLKPEIRMWEPRKDSRGKLINSSNYSGYEAGGKFGADIKRSVTEIKFGRDTRRINEAYHFIHKHLHNDAAAIFLWNRNLHIAIQRKFEYTVVKDPINFLKSVKDWGKTE